MGDNDIGSNVEDADPQIREIVQRIVHPNYEPPSVYNDIGLFRLNASVQFNRFVLPICLNAETQLATEQNVIAVGWGRTGPGTIVIVKCETKNKTEIQYCVNSWRHRKKVYQRFSCAFQFRSGSGFSYKFVCLFESERNAFNWTQRTIIFKHD